MMHPRTERRIEHLRNDIKRFSRELISHLEAVAKADAPETVVDLNYLDARLDSAEKAVASLESLRNGVNA